MNEEQVYNILSHLQPDLPVNEPITHSGAWAVALIVIVIVSLALYHYLAPITWKEWASAGVVQPFIIALYAEMYGLPLTIYLLVRFFGLDRTHLNANLWSTLLGYGETGMMISMVLGYGFLFAGIGIFMEGWREFHRARKENRLIKDRLYGGGAPPAIHGAFHRAILLLSPSSLWLGNDGPMELAKRWQ